MDDPPVAVMRKPCCVCAEPGGQHCTKCKSRHYCGKACQLVDWYDRGHKAQCKQLAAEFQDRLLDVLMPAKLKIKEKPAIVEDVAPAAGSRAASRLPAVREEKTAVGKATTLNDAAPDWLGTCAICLDVLPVEANLRRFYECCCKMMCMACSVKCRQHDDRCPLCRTPASKSDAELLRRLQKHVDKGNALAQMQLGNAYSSGARGLKESFKRAFQLYELAAAQGCAVAQHNLGVCYDCGEGVKIDHKAATRWCQRAAEQGLGAAQCNLGTIFYHGQGVAQSHEEAVKWYRLAAAQGEPIALYYLGLCLETGAGVPQDFDEALRLYKRAAAKGHAEAAAVVAEHEASLAAARSV